MKRFTTLLLLIMPFVFGAPSASAQDTLWGAIMVGPDGAYGWAVNADTEAEAELAARFNCEGQCTHGFTFYNTCGAIAIGGDEAYWGTGFTQFDAEDESLDSCEADWGDYCEVAVWACTD